MAARRQRARHPRRLHAALRAAGRLIIIDFIPNEDRTAPILSVLFALNMLIHTEVGDVYTLREYRSWLNEAGFGALEAIELADDFPAPAIVASKRCRQDS